MIDNYNANTSHSKELHSKWEKRVFKLWIRLNFVSCHFAVFCFSTSFKSVHSPWVLKFTFQTDTLMNIIGNVFRIFLFFFFKYVFFSLSSRLILSFRSFYFCFETLTKIGKSLRNRICTIDNEDKSWYGICFGWISQWVVRARLWHFDCNCEKRNCVKSWPPPESILHATRLDDAKM